MKLISFSVPWHLATFSQSQEKYWAQWSPSHSQSNDTWQRLARSVRQWGREKGAVNVECSNHYFRHFSICCITSNSIWCYWRGADSSSGLSSAQSSWKFETTRKFTNLYANFICELQQSKKGYWGKIFMGRTYCRVMARYSTYQLERSP